MFEEVQNQKLKIREQEKLIDKFRHEISDMSKAQRHCRCN